MDEYTNESAEIQEVAEPETEELESAENQEVAEPDVSDYSEDSESTDEQPTGRTEADAAFAEMRRQIAAQEQMIGDLERRNGAMSGALSRYFEGENDDELVINANAYAEERDPDEYRVEYERGLELEDLRARNADLEERLIDAEVTRLMQDGLREIQEIDPAIKSLDELGDSFANYIAAGLSTKEAYYASKVLNESERVHAPDAIGKVADTKAERDYFTSEELDALTDEDLNDDKIYEKAMASLQRL